MELEEMQVVHSVVIDAPAEALYDMVADVTRMGEWSPACVGATWDDGAGPTVGSWFTGHNKIGDHAYDARCEITAAERPSTIAWMQAGKDEGFAEWRYSFAPVDGGTEVTESWSLLRAFPSDRVPEDRVQMMIDNFGNGIRQTLDTLKSTAEA